MDHLLNKYSFSEIYALDCFVADKRSEGLSYEEIIEMMDDYIEAMEGFSAE